MLPNFLIIGAMKSGTTTLYTHLKQHPQVFMPTWKEPGFFAIDSRWRRGAAWYERLFSGATGRLAIGEASPCYAKYPLFDSTAERIHAVIPNTRLIYILRNPVDRIESHYLHAVHAGDELRPPDEAVWENPVYLDTSRYFMQLEHYLAHFPAERIQILLLDDLQRDPDRTMQSIFAFLGVDRDHQLLRPSLCRNESRGKHGRSGSFVRLLQRSSMYHRLSSRMPDRAKVWARQILNRPIAPIMPFSEELRQRLRETLSDDVQRMSRFLNRDLDTWLTAPDDPNPVDPNPVDPTDALEQGAPTGTANGDPGGPPPEKHAPRIC